MLLYFGHMFECLKNQLHDTWKHLPQNLEQIRYCHERKKTAKLHTSFKDLHVQYWEVQRLKYKKMSSIWQVFIIVCRYVLPSFWYSFHFYILVVEYVNSMHIIGFLVSTELSFCLLPEKRSAVSVFDIVTLTEVSSVTSTVLYCWSLLDISNRYM